MFSISLQALLEEDCPNLISAAITVDKKFLIKTVQGVRKPRESNYLADCDRKERLVILSGKFTFKLKMKVSFIEFHVSPRALGHSSGWISKLELSPTQFEEIRESTSDELDHHFLKWNPLVSSMLESVLSRRFPLHSKRL
ncbi:hypothetical protein TNIN_484681 [Trichonephila inaurata madagascariensis]|uniref:Uncharacterized protein n=1 Tax=Trichonephila inaurata madagascariensis TaxID=2747483 RepID=A0A8X6IY66_9ARAC|nr:hypothetical protein TNIN_484681 [Trichonephila inaurata madagascariensis]